LLKDDMMVNQKVEINVEDHDVSYKSSVQAVDENSFAIAIPYHKGEPLILRSGDTIIVKLFTAKERFIFSSKVIKRKQDQIPLYVLTYPEKVYRLQAREHVRVEVNLDIHYQVITEEEKRQGKFFNPSAQALTVDLSGGGALLAIDEKLPEGQPLYLEFTIKYKKGEKLIQTFGRVVRCRPAEGTKKNLAGIRFEGLDERVRDVLIEFLFERMRLQRRLKDD
jgi:c-di-GMP-binding flagellar brake protein YcgR